MTRSSISKNTIFFYLNENSVFWMNFNFDRLLTRLNVLFIFPFAHLFHLQHHRLSQRKLISEEADHILHAPMEFHHFLMMSPALLWCSGGDYERHLLENPLRFPNEIVFKQRPMFTNEPKVHDLLLYDPPPLQYLWILLLFWDLLRISTVVIGRWNKRAMVLALSEEMSCWCHALLSFYLVYLHLIFRCLNNICWAWIFGFKTFRTALAVQLFSLLFFEKRLF